MAELRMASKKLNDTNQQCTNYKNVESNDARRINWGTDEQIAYKKVLN